MRHRHDRDVDARKCTDLTRVHAARIDHDLRLDLALVRDDCLHTASLNADLGHACPLIDLRAAPPRPLRQRERELARVDVAVRREEGGAEHTVRRHRREQGLRVAGRDQLEREAERLRPPRLACDLLHTLLGRRESQRPYFSPARLETDLLFERPVQIDRAHHHLRQRQGAPQLADEAGRVKGRATRQLRSLDEHDIVPTESRQPVEDRAAPDSSSDHDGSSAITHAPHPKLLKREGRRWTGRTPARRGARRSSSTCGPRAWDAAGEEPSSSRAPRVSPTGVRARPRGGRSSDLCNPGARRAGRAPPRAGAQGEDSGVLEWASLDRLTDLRKLRSICSKTALIGRVRFRRFLPAPSTGRR